MKLGISEWKDASLKLVLIRLLNKYYRILKGWLLIHKPPVVTGLFFFVLSLLDRLISARRLTKFEQLANTLWKNNYFLYYKLNPQEIFKIKTNYPVAYTSDDHKFPRGTMHDNSKNYRFNLKLYELFGYREDIHLLDLGCSGGGFVKSILEDGYTAIGLEGSDVSRRFRSGEWDTIPNHLFTCDLSKPFQVYTGHNKKALFDMITAWEVVEHIAEPDLEQLVRNIRTHLKPGGYFVCSIDLLPDENPVIGGIYHRTLKSSEWWKKYFLDRGFTLETNHPFETQDMVRGNGLGLKDWHPDDGYGMHLILKKSSR